MPSEILSAIWGTCTVSAWRNGEAWNERTIGEGGANVCAEKGSGRRETYVDRDACPAAERRIAGTDALAMEEARAPRQAHVLAKLRRASIFLRRMVNKSWGSANDRLDQKWILVRLGAFLSDDGRLRIFNWSKHQQRNRPTRGNTRNRLDALHKQQKGHEAAWTCTALHNQVVKVHIITLFWAHFPFHPHWSPFGTPVPYAHVFTSCARAI